MCSTRKEIDLSCISANDPQLVRLADAIAQRVGQQRFHVWFNNSTRLDLRQDGLEIAVPNDFISEWIGTNFTRPIQEAAHEVLGLPAAGAVQRRAASCSRSRRRDGRRQWRRRGTPAPTVAGRRGKTAATGEAAIGRSTVNGERR